MSKRPFMKWYPGQYADKTRHLDDLEDLAYRRLLEAIWAAGGKLPRDDIRLARIARMTPGWWSEHRDIILAFFTKNGGHIHHERVTRDITYARRASEAKKRGPKGTALDSPNETSELAFANACRIEDREEQRLEPSLTASSGEADKNANPKIIDLDAARKAKALELDLQAAEEFR